MEVDSKLFLNVYVEKLTQKNTNLNNQLMMNEVQLHFATEQLKNYDQLTQKVNELTVENARLQGLLNTQPTKKPETKKSDY